MKQILLAGIISLSVVPSVSLADEWYVDLAAGTAGAACTETAPCLSLDDMVIAGFASGDSIYVAGETTDDMIIVNNAFDGTATSPTLITAWPDKTAPTLTGTNPANLAITVGSYITFDGFIINNGTVGVEINSNNGAATNITLQNFVVINNGIGVNMVTVETATIQNSIIASNTSKGIEVGTSTNLQFVNNVIANHPTGSGLVIRSENDGTLAYHNVIAGNGTGVDVQALASNTQVYNNIFYGNTDALNYVDGTVSAADYNDYYGNTEISVNYPTLADLQQSVGLDLSSLEVDPQFVDPDSAEPNFHLQATSQLIDAGYDLGAAVATDIDAETRPYGAGFDIGLDELPVVPTPTSLKVKQITAHQATVQWQITSGYSVTKYKVEYSRKKSFTNAKRVGTKTTKKTLTKLKAGTKYFVRVKAIYQTDYATYKSAKTTAKSFTTKQAS